MLERSSDMAEGWHTMSDDGPIAIRWEKARARRMYAVTLVVVAVAVGATCVLSIGAMPANAAEGCANEAIRVEQGSTFLPDCRAYEFASPGSNPFLESDGVAESARAAVGGGAIAFYSRYPVEGSVSGGYFYVASRHAGGWSVEGVTPQESPDGSEATVCLPSIFFSEDLASNVFTDGWDVELESSGESYCQHSEEELVPGAFATYGNLILTEASGRHRWVNVTEEGTVPGNARLQDVTPDLSHVVFGEDAQLAPEALAGLNLYEWADGMLRLVTYLPDGEPAVGKIADAGKDGSGEGAYEGHVRGLAPVTHAMSADGETVFFYVQRAGITYLYARTHAMQPPSAVESKSTKVNGEQCTEPAKACTVEIDATQASGASGGGVFWDASENGSRVFFADESRLTSSAGARSGEADLYEYDLETKQLTDLTPESLAHGPADVRGYSGGSEDGSYIYFVAYAALTGAQQNSQGSAAVAEEPNLYLDHDGTLTFIATLLGEAKHSAVEQDFEDWQESPPPEPKLNDGRLATRVSPNGDYIGFASANSLTGAENKDANTGKRDKEIFLYDAVTNKLECVSCSSSGALPVGSAYFSAPEMFANEKPLGAPGYIPRNVLDDGRVFFTTPNALLPQDIDGTSDVYEYEEGALSLISSGTSSSGSTFYDASASGDDVFFVTAQSLVRADKENNDGIYDARVEGGFPPGPGELVEAEACSSEEACRAPAREAPSGQFAASSTLSSPGNLLAPPSKPGEAPVTKKATKRTLTRAQELANALKACRKQSKRKRGECEAGVRKRYGSKTSAKAKKGGGR